MEVIEVYEYTPNDELYKATFKEEDKELIMYFVHNVSYENKRLVDVFLSDGNLIKKLLKSLREISPLIKFAEKFKNKVELDVKSLIEVVIPKKYDVCEYIAKYLEKYMRLKELLKVKIFGDIDDSRLYHYIRILPIFEDSDESLDISEELENNIYKSPLSNRILVFSIFK
ncbi:hypothetical protein JH146_0789 [Methanocaldococcus bathoardescens]|uniref:Uncharacterized protein n=1 Tax=Methanocaldococcus bathoardescens TaxID=1301915 RepID=A0A076LBB0_9EURY|nr:hypothetical protein [Methanocaldococcus bathoardescens]AIJ05635.1 hypothetical protein JH146_0789 [Methanocaldococcus bathoardescens]